MNIGVCVCVCFEDMDKGGCQNIKFTKCNEGVLGVTYGFHISRYLMRVVIGTDTPVCTLT
jgi:hypothetical protein